MNMEKQSDSKKPYLAHSAHSVFMATLEPEGQHSV